MAGVPAFSTFTAFSELLVTAAVFYFFARALRHDDYRWPLITITIAFETLVNITYMAARLTQHAESALPRPAWATWLLGIHGTLSLVMFIGLVALVLAAFRHERVYHENLFRRRLRLTYTFLGLWIVAVLSGELLYVLQATGTLQA